MTKTQIANELGRIADELEPLEARVTALRARRLELWLAGRALNPKMTQRSLSALSRLTEGAVTQALRKVRLNGDEP